MTEPDWTEERCSLSGGPRHGRTFLAHKWQMGQGWLGRYGPGEYYRRVVGTARFRYKGTMQPEYTKAPPPKG